MSSNAIRQIRDQQRKQQCSDHSLSEQVTDTKYRCPECGCTEDIRSLNNDDRSMSSASAIDRGRSMW